MINFGVLIKVAKFKVCMSSVVLKELSLKKAVKHKMACCIANKHCNIEKRTPFRGKTSRYLPNEPSTTFLLPVYFKIQ